MSLGGDTAQESQPPNGSYRQDPKFPILTMVMMMEERMVMVTMVLEMVKRTANVYIDVQYAVIARPCVKCFTYIYSLKPHNNLMR